MSKRVIPAFQEYALRKRQVPGIACQLHIAVSSDGRAAAHTLKADSSLPVRDGGEMDLLVRHPREYIQLTIRIIEPDLPGRRILPSSMRTAPAILDSDIETGAGYG